MSTATGREAFGSHSERRIHPRILARPAFLLSLPVFHICKLATLQVLVWTSPSTLNLRATSLAEELPFD